MAHRGRRPSRPSPVKVSEHRACVVLVCPGREWFHWDPSKRHTSVLIAVGDCWDAHLREEAILSRVRWAHMPQDGNP